jgi:hypothetical protein
VGHDERCGSKLQVHYTLQALKNLSIKSQYSVSTKRFHVRVGSNADENKTVDICFRKPAFGGDTKPPTHCLTIVIPRKTRLYVRSRSQRLSLSEVRRGIKTLVHTNNRYKAGTATCQLLRDTKTDRASFIHYIRKKSML